MHDTRNKLELTKIVPPPSVPDKTDILPVHTSDRAVFKRCRRKWDWSSPIRENLVPTVFSVGVNMNLWFGSGIHWALAQYYDPILHRDPVEAWIWWYELTWKGGIVSPDAVELSYDRNPVKVEKGYKVRGLDDLVFDADEQEEEFENHRELGIKMMEHYLAYAGREDDFVVIAPEHTFSVPLGIRAIDPRDGIEKDVHYRGTQDAIVQHQESGRYGILEHKTAVSIAENYFRKLEKDEQCTSYMWSGEQEAKIHDLEYERIDFVIYNGLRKAYPRPPTMLDSGKFSIDRQKESPTYEMLMECIEREGLAIVIEKDERYQNYIEYIKEHGEKQFIERKLVTRNRAEIDSCGERIRMEVYDMLGIMPNGEEHPSLPFIYPNPTGDFLCLGCEFRVPCIARDDGSDYTQILADNFESNHGR